MKKIFILGLQEDKKLLLTKLQEAGVIHVEPIKEMKNVHSSLHDDLANVEKSLDILNNYKKNDFDSNKQEKIEDKLATINEILQEFGMDPVFDAVDFAKQIQIQHKQIQFLEDSKNDLEKTLNDLQIWGNFSGTLVKKLAEQNVKIRFWKCPVKEFGKFNAEAIPFQKQEGKFIYFATVSYNEEVEACSEAREIFIKQGPYEVKENIADIELKSEKYSKTLLQFTSYLSDLQNYAITLKEQIDFENAKNSLLTEKEIFGLKGWVPEDGVDKLEQTVKKLSVALKVADCGKDETAPTLIRNPRWIQSILDVVKLYATPGYKEWDCSASVYFAFAIFFGMIIGDAGYGALLVAIMLYFRKKLMKSEVGSRVFRLFVTISTSCIIYGAISCTWFAINMDKIPDNSIFAFLKNLKFLQIIDASNNELMMLISIYMGIIHLSIARLIQAVRLWGSGIWAAELGWIVMMWSAMAHQHWGCLNLGAYGFFTGLGTVLLFSSNSLNPLKRIGGGFLGILGLSQNFADVLSYLRLFALGLATVVMGGIFNDLGWGVHTAIPGILGYILMVLIIFMGHTVNLVLGIMAGFIHGLRLNFLEFYRYCYEGTGYDYNPLKLQQKIVK